MKKDMRISYPLWQVGFIALLLGLTLMIGLFSDYEFAKISTGLLFEFTLEGNIFWLVLMWLAVFILFFSLFVVRTKQHNKLHPAHQINIFTIKPQEFMADDELFEAVTMRATKKVYAYFNFGLPTLAAFVLLLPVGKIGMLSGLLLLAIGQYFIYYLEIRKYVSEDEA